MDQNHHRWLTHQSFKVQQNHHHRCLPHHCLPHWCQDHQRGLRHQRFSQLICERHKHKAQVLHQCAHHPRHQAPVHKRHHQASPGPKAKPPAQGPNQQDQPRQQRSRKLEKALLPTTPAGPATCHQPKLDPSEPAVCHHQELRRKLQKQTLQPKQIPVWQYSQHLLLPNLAHRGLLLPLHIETPSWL